MCCFVCIVKEYTQLPDISVNCWNIPIRPMYTVSSQNLKEQNITDTLQANLEPLFRVSHYFSHRLLAIVRLCIYSEGDVA